MKALHSAPVLEDEISWMNTDRLHEEISRTLGVLKIICCHAARLVQRSLVTSPGSTT